VLKFRTTARFRKEFFYIITHNMANFFSMPHSQASWFGSAHQSERRSVIERSRNDLPTSPFNSREREREGEKSLL
jgi:hypothetical protein